MKNFLENLALFGVVVGIIVIGLFLFVLPFAALVLCVWLLCRIWY